MTQVHLYWLTATPDVAPWPGRWLLGGAEQARAARWLNAGRRREFLWGRALLHHVVAAHGLPSASLRFHASGRPFLEGPGDISLSHAGEHVMVGLCGDGWDWGWIPMVAVMVVVVALIIWMIVAVSHRMSAPPPGAGAPPPHQHPGPHRSPEEILAERLAHGDIEVDDYHRRLEALRKQPPAH